MNVRYIKSVLRKRFPYLVALYKAISEAGSITFDGWGMKTTATLPPWFGDDVWKGSPGLTQLLQVERDIILDAQNGKFISTQFVGEDMSFVLESLRWRHYFVFMSCLLASQRVKERTRFTLVECGVCDGLTMRFSTGAAKLSFSNQWHGYLYDSWEKMPVEGLTPSETDIAGSYDNISLECTKLNLKSEEDNLTFNKGFIPASLHRYERPDLVHWLHIDLNASMPTLASLEFFRDSFAEGAVILLDDYGWPSHVDTRRVADEFAKKMNTFCLQLPTGQALIILL